MQPDQAVHAVHAVHPVLERAFGALDASQVRWCLLRGEAALADPPGDVDLLVAAADLPRLDTALEEAEPACTPWCAATAATRAGDAATAVFELDVESDVEFGLSGHFAVNWLRPDPRGTKRPALLAGRVRTSITAGPRRCLLALLLHCVVDKARSRPHARPRCGRRATRRGPRPDRHRALPAG
jgi:hypothetical protein